MNQNFFLSGRKKIVYKIMIIPKMGGIL